MRRNPLMLPFLVSCVWYTITTFAFKVEDMVSPLSILKAAEMRDAAIASDTQLYDAVKSVDLNSEYDDIFKNTSLVPDSEDHEACVYGPQYVSDTKVVEYLTFMQEHAVLNNDNLNETIFFMLEGLGFLDDPVNYIPKSLRGKVLTVELDSSLESSENATKVTLGDLWTTSVIGVIGKLYGKKKVEKLLKGVDFTDYQLGFDTWSGGIDAVKIYRFASSVREDMCRLAWSFDNDTVDEEYITTAASFVVKLYSQTYIQFLGILKYLTYERSRLVHRPRSFTLSSFL